MTVTYWKPGDDRPTGKPRRYVGSDGYIILRWHGSDGDMIEAREHVWLAGKPGHHVHHINGVRADNRPENLLAVTPAQHRAIHAAQNRVNDERAVALYVAGLTTTQVGEVMNCDPATVTRVLQRNDVTYRHPPRRADIDEERVLALLRAGVRVGAVARVLGVGRGPVDRVRREAGIPAFRAGRYPTNGAVEPFEAERRGLAESSADYRARRNAS